jgi:hypothetical protein
LHSSRPCVISGSAPSKGWDFCCSTTIVIFTEAYIGQGTEGFRCHFKSTPDR